MVKKVVWNDKCVPKSVNTYSPSWKKPAEFMQAITPVMVDAGLEVVESTKVKLSSSAFKRVHDPEFVSGVMTGRIANGFGTRQTEVAESCLYTSGAMVTAVELASQGHSCCVPVSGFHHAGYDFSGGYCTFNGLAVAAVAAAGLGMNPGILDCDMHYGNGTVDIFDKLNLQYSHFTYGGTQYADKAKSQLFLGRLPHILACMISDCGVLIYQAGADPHIDDPLGGCMTSEELRQRDKIVFDFCEERDIPVVWNLAGGYQKPLSKVLSIHRTTFEEWLNAPSICKTFPNGIPTGKHHSMCDHSKPFKGDNGIQYKTEE